MAQKFVSDEIMDNGLNGAKNTINRIAIASAAGSVWADFASYAVGTLSTSSTNLTVANGDSSGRKITHSAATITVGTTSTVNHIYLGCTTGSGTLFFCGTCAPTAVTATGTVILSAWDIDEIADVTQ